MSETGQDIKKSIKYLSDRKQREKQRIFNNLFDINKKQHQLKNDPHRKRQVWKPDEHDAQHFVITGNGYCAMSGKNTTLFEYIKTAKFKSNNKKAKEYICTFEKFLRLKTGYSTDTGIDNERNYSTCAEPMAIVRALKNGVEPQDIEFKSIVKLSKLSEGQKTPCVDYCSEYILIGQDKKYHLDWDVVTDFVASVAKTEEKKEVIKKKAKNTIKKPNPKQSQNKNPFAGLLDLEDSVDSDDSSSDENKE